MSTRICLDLTPLEMKDRHGGFGRYAIYLLRELLGLCDGETELLAVLSSRGPVLPGREALAATESLAPEIASRLHRMQRRVLLGPILRRSRLDLFHVIVPWAQPWLTGCPSVLTAHDLVPVVLPEPGLATRLLAGPRRLLHARRYRRAEHLIAISEQTRRDLIRELAIAPERVTVVGHGVDVELFHADAAPGERAATCGAHDIPEKWIVCVSSDHYRKNHRRLLEAWLRVADRIEEGLVFVGKALYEDTFTSVVEEVRARGLAERFRWLDSVSDAELPALYRGATACVAPSRYEGFGMTLLEAMACGTPVLAARNGAYEEVGADAALFFPADGTEELAALLLRITADAALRGDLRARGLERARAMSWRATAAATLEVYRGVLAARML